jgi:hypothetical protein
MLSFILILTLFLAVEYPSYSSKQSIQVEENKLSYIHWARFEEQ